MKDYDKAEAAYKKATELKADDATAYNGLANVYNAQRKFDLAAAASAKATELASARRRAGGAAAAPMRCTTRASSCGTAARSPTRRSSSRPRLQANPNHAEAHYQLGMALVNEGNLAGAGDRVRDLPEARADGPNAATAKALVAQLKK